MRLSATRAARAGLALVIATGTLAGGVAHAQYYPDAAPARYGHAPYGPADPCARTAAERRLGWGIVGLIAGGFAGGAVAASGVVAEGAALGAFVGSIIGGAAGASSAACGTAAYASYPAYQTVNQNYAYSAPPRADYYEYRRSYQSHDAPAPPPPCCAARGYDGYQYEQYDYDRSYSEQSAGSQYDDGPEPGYYDDGGY